MAKQTKAKRLSPRVTRENDVIALRGVFSRRNPESIARSLKRYAERSPPSKGSSFRSAIALINFYIHREGPKLGADRRDVLERAMGELRALYGTRAVRSKGATGRSRAPRKVSVSRAETLKMRRSSART